MLDNSRLGTQKQEGKPDMVIPTEPIGSIPRPPELIQALAQRGGADPASEPLYDEAIRD